MKGRKTGFPEKIALKRIYKVRKLGVGGAIYVPKSLINKKIKLKIIK
jgi:hypothetical protein